MSLGFPMGRWNAHTYTSAAAVLAGGLNNGALWIIITGGKPIEAGIWPQTPGGGPVVCPPGSVVFVGDPEDWIYEQQIDATQEPPIVPIVAAGVGFVINNPV